MNDNRVAQGHDYDVLANFLGILTKTDYETLEFRSICLSKSEKVRSIAQEIRNKFFPYFCFITSISSSSEERRSPIVETEIGLIKQYFEEENFVVLGWENHYTRFEDVVSSLSVASTMNNVPSQSLIVMYYTGHSDDGDLGGFTADDFAGNLVDLDMTLNILLIF